MGRGGRSERSPGCPPTSSFSSSKRGRPFWTSDVAGPPGAVPKGALRRPRSRLPMWEAGQELLCAVVKGQWWAGPGWAWQERLSPVCVLWPYVAMVLGASWRRSPFPRWPPSVSLGMEAGVRGSQQWRSRLVLLFLEVLGRDAGDVLAEGTGGRVEGGSTIGRPNQALRQTDEGGTILSLQGPHGGDTANTILNTLPALPHRCL